MTTNDRELVLEFGDRARRRNVGALDAPVTGAIDGARRGALTIFVGGAEVVIERVGRYLEVARRIIVCGPLASGNVVKLVTTLLWFINAAAIGEGLVLGNKAGVDLAVLWDAIKRSVGDTFVARHDGPSIFTGHYDPSFTLDLCCKDLGLIDALSQTTGTQIPMTAQARERFEAAREAFGGDQAELLVCELIEDASGVVLRVPGDWPRPLRGVSASVRGCDFGRGPRAKRRCPDRD